MASCVGVGAPCQIRARTSHTLRHASALPSPLDRFVGIGRGPHHPHRDRWRVAGRGRAFFAGDARQALHAERAVVAAVVVRVAKEVPGRGGAADRGRLARVEAAAAREADGVVARVERERRGDARAKRRHHLVGEERPRHRRDEPGERSVGGPRSGVSTTSSNVQKLHGAATNQTVASSVAGARWPTE